MSNASSFPSLSFSSLKQSWSLWTTPVKFPSPQIIFHYWIRNFYADSSWLTHPILFVSYKFHCLSYFVLFWLHTLSRRFLHCCNLWSTVAFSPSHIYEQQMLKSPLCTPFNFWAVFLLPHLFALGQCDLHGNHRNTCNWRIVSWNSSLPFHWDWILSFWTRGLTLVFVQYLSILEFSIL